MSRVGVLVALFAALLVAGCAQPGPTPGPEPTTSSTVTPTTVPTTTTVVPPPTSTVAPPPPPPPVNEKPGALRPLPAPVNCTVFASDARAVQAAVSSAKPGARVCVSGNLGTLEVKVTNSGTPERPIAILGDGNVTVGKVRVDASWVFVSGFNIKTKNAPGIWLRGDNLTAIDNVVDSPRGGDGDGARIFGGNIKFLHNTVSNTSNTEGHADCVQNYSTESAAPETHDVFIEWNRCASIANIGVIMEGPHSSYGDGSKRGNTYRVFIRDNYFQAKSAQAIWFDDVQDVIIERNHFDGGVHHALGATNKSTGITFRDNKVTDIKCEVGLSKDSLPGYVGPESRCAP